MAMRIATHNAPPASSAKSTTPPNQTLYLTNLPEKLSKPDLRLLLYTLFATHGPVLDVNAMRSNKMRGQAHVAFRSVGDATQAMRALQGFEFCGKPMRIQYAKGKSDAIAKLDGSYRMSGAGDGGAALGTELQKAVFGGVPGSGPAAVAPAVVAAKKTDGVMEVDGVEGPKGVKRPRDEKEDEEGGEEEDAPMEEDSDDAPMEEDSDDDDD